MTSLMSFFGLILPLSYFGTPAGPTRPRAMWAGQCSNSLFINGFLDRLRHSGHLPLSHPHNHKMQAYALNIEDERPERC